MIAFAFHVLSLVFYIHYRRRKILTQCRQLRKKGLLSEGKFEVLMKRYNGFLGFLETFPDPDEFGEFYLAGKSVIQFKNRSSRILKYLGVTIFFLTVILIIIASSMPNLAEA